MIVVMIVVFMVPRVISAALPGDANGDGKVDGVDYVLWLNNYGTTPPTPTPTPSGITHDQLRTLVLDYKSKLPGQWRERLGYQRQNRGGLKSS